MDVIYLENVYDHDNVDGWKLKNRCLYIIECFSTDMYNNK